MHALSRISKKQLLVLGIIVALLIAIPLTLFLLSQQQKTKSSAAQSTIVSFDNSPSSNNQVTLTKAKGDTFTLPVYVDPGSGDNANTVSVLTLQIKFDPTYLSVADPTKCISPSGGQFLSQVTTQPTCSSGDALIRLAATGITGFVTTKQKVAEITFTVSPTAPAGQTQVTFDTLTQAGSSAVSDPESNVINGTLPAVITIGASTSITPSPSPTGAPTATPVPQATNTPVPTATPAPQATPVQLPVCSSLTTDVATTGTAPYVINFTAIGSDQFGSLQKATFNFGDGTTQDVAIAAPSVAPTVTPTPTPTVDPNTTPTDTPTPDPNVTPTVTPTPTTAPTVTNGTAQLGHTYNKPGTYQATVTFTDDKNAVSLPGSCTQTITVNAVAQSPTPTPTVAATGPGDNIVGIGIVGIVLTIIGGLLFFAL